MPEWDVDMHGVKRVTRNWRGKGNNEYETGDRRRKNGTANRTENHNQKKAGEHTSTWIFSLGIDRDMVLGGRWEEAGETEEAGKLDPTARQWDDSLAVSPSHCGGSATLVCRCRCAGAAQTRWKETEKCIFYLPCHVSCLASLCPQSCPQSCPSSVCPVQPDRKLSYPNSAASPAPPASAPQTPAGTPPCSMPAGRSPSGIPASRHPVCAPRTSPPCLPRQMT